MVEAMLLAGLRRCEVLGLRLGDIHVADRRVFVVDGKGGHQRFTPMANRFFTSRRPLPRRGAAGHRHATGCSSC